LFQSNSGSKIAPAGGQYVLSAGKDFELRVFHYDPDADAHTGYKATRWLRLSSVDPGLQLRSNPLLAIDSPYDLKSIQIRTGSTLANQYSSLELTDVPKSDRNDSSKSEPNCATKAVVARESAQNEDALHLFLPVKITGSVWRNVGLASVLGVLLTMQQLVSLFSKPDANPSAVIILLTILLGIVTAVVAVFGLRRSV
jgi:hypothetical protein